MSQSVGLLFVGGFILRWWLSNFGIDFGLIDDPKHLRVSKATTHFVEPLREDGSLDFFNAMNKEMSKGVTPENNAVVLLAQVSGPDICHESVRDESGRQIGIEELAGKPKLINFEKFVKMAEEEFSGIDKDIIFDQWYERTEFVTSSPWTDEQFPAIAALLDHNEPSLSLVTRKEN